MKREVHVGWFVLIGVLSMVLATLLTVALVIRTKSSPAPEVATEAAPPALWESFPKPKPPTPQPSTAGDWRSWDWEVVPPIELLPALYAGKERGDWLLPKKLLGMELQEKDYGKAEGESAGTAYTTSSPGARTLHLQLRSNHLVDTFNLYAELLPTGHYIGRYFCGLKENSDPPAVECILIAEDTLILASSRLGGLTEEEIAAALDALVDHLLANR